MANKCELYPRVPSGLLAAPEATARLLRSGVPAILVTGVERSSTALGALHLFITAARGRDIAVLLESDASLAKELNASGIHISAGLPNGPTPAEARALLGANALIGMSCGLSHHDAMTIGESGADYIAFGADPAEAPSDVAETTQWWAEIFEIPCVAWGHDSHDEATLTAFIAAGADYLSLPAAYWLEAGAADQLARLLNVCTTRSIPA